LPFYDEATGSVGGSNEAGDWYQFFTPITPASHFMEAFYGDIWDAIGSAGAPGPGFDDTLLEFLEDNGAGLQWDDTIDGCENYSIFWSFGEIPTPPPTSVTISGLGAQNSATLPLAVGGIVVVAAAAWVVLRSRRRMA
jgi:hypothetical protein